MYAVKFFLWEFFSDRLKYAIIDPLCKYGNKHDMFYLQATIPVKLLFKNFLEYNAIKNFETLN